MEVSNVLAVIARAEQRAAFAGRSGGPKSPTLPDRYAKIVQHFSGTDPRLNSRVRRILEQDAELQAIQRARGVPEKRMARLISKELRERFNL